MNFLPATHNLRVVLDSVLLINAVRKPFSLEGRVLSYAVSDSYVLITSEAILEEVSQKLETKFGYTDNEILRALRPIRIIAKIVKPYTRSLTVILRDKNDEPIIRTAIAGRAHLIITRDRDLLSLKSCENIAISHIFDFRHYFPDENKR